MKKEYFDIILKHIKDKCPIKRPDKLKYSDEYYLENILSLLTDFVSWRSLRFSLFYKNGALTGKDKKDILKDHHYKSIWRKYHKWCKAKVFESVYKDIKNNINIQDNDDHIKLIIDATNIINKRGIEYVGYGSETKKKKFTSLTIISDINFDSITINANKTKQKIIQNSEKHCSTTLKV